MLILLSSHAFLRGISSGWYVDLALAYSLGAGLTPDVTCLFNREEGTGSRRDFLVGCPSALAASLACYVTDRWFSPHFSVVADFRIGAWTADIACPVACLPIWPACWLDTPDRSSLSSTRVVQDASDVFWVVPEEVVMALRDAASGSSVDDFWTIWSRYGELGLFRAYSKAGGPVVAGSSAFLGRGLLRIRSRRLDAELLAAMVLVGCIGLARVMILFGGLVHLCQSLCFSSWLTLGLTIGGGIVTVVTPGGALPLSGSCPLGRGTALATVTTSPIS